MTQPLEHVEYLSKEIGPRPAGTEEEQNAALYIADQLQKESGYHAEIEEFTGSSNFPYIQAICCGVIILVAILAMAVPMLAIPAFILALIATVIYVFEVFDKPVVTRILARSASQNVVAKYQPFSEGEGEGKPSGRSRKIVLVARYDSGKVTPSLVSRIESMKLPFGMIFAGAAAVSTILLLVRIFVGSVGGAGILVFNVIAAIVLIIVALPLVKTILLQIAPYNEGANDNASGVAALLEVARRISRGSLSEADLVDENEGVAIHGEAAAIANGLVPEGAEIRYEAERLVPPEIEPLDDEERLLSAKAAIAAFTGKPVERKTFGSVASNLVNTRADKPLPTIAASNAPQVDAVQPAPVEAVPAAAAAEEPVAWAEKPFEAPVVDNYYVEAEGFDNAPDWFVAAQQKAKRPTGQTGSIQRSRYTDAIEAAEREAAERERIRLEEEYTRLEEERRQREQAMREALSEQLQQQETEVQAAAEALETQKTIELSVDAIEVPVNEVPAGGEQAIEEVPDRQLAEEPADDKVEIEPAFAAPMIAEGLPPDATIAVAPISMADLAKELQQSTDVEDVDVAFEPESELSVQEPVEEVREEPASSRREKMSSLPTIDEPKPAGGNGSPSRSGLFRMLREDVPSLSGVLNMPEEQEAPSKKPAKRVDPAMLPHLTLPNDPVDPVDYDMEALYTEPDNSSEPDEGRSRWNGGAFSRLRLGHVSTKSGEESDADEPEEVVVEEESEEAAIAEEMEKIYHFRNPLYNNEIWFVAIGCNTDLHDGALAFIEEHQSDLRGAMIIEVDSVGQGELSVASEEGRFLKVTASSRIKRYTRAAQEATGIRLESLSLAGRESIASIAQKAGFQSMHLFGAENGRPALSGSADDVLENLDEEVLDEHINFLMELLKHN